MTTIESPVIESFTLDPALREYLRALVETRTVNIEATLDESHVIGRLEAHWPHDASDRAQAEQLWKFIEEVVQSIPAIKTTPNIILRVVASPHPLVPDTIPSPHGHSAIATCDATSGKVYRCALPGAETLPSLDAMKVPAGLMVIAQPMPALVSQYSDNRSSGLGAANVYTDRASDKHPPQNKTDEATQTAPPSSGPEPRPG